MSQHSHISRRQQGSSVSSLSGPNRQRRVPTKDEVYNYALRIAYLNYLQQPRKRITVAAPLPPKRSYSSSAGEILQEFTRDLTSSTRTSKSAKLPKDEFLPVLQRRLEGVVTGREQAREYKDPNIKRTFAVFLNKLMEPKWRASMVKSRRAEDLILIFVGHSTRELNTAMNAGTLTGVSSENVGLLVDRHVAMFVRLILMCLKDQWSSSSGELVAKLSTLESKLLAHDQNLAENATTAQQQITEEAPLSYSINEMPLAQTVSKIFQVAPTQVQNDINRYRPVWTEDAAIKDLKFYNESLNLMNNYTLKADHFDTDAGYDIWKSEESKAIAILIQQMVTNNPSLATTSSRQSYLAPGTPSSEFSGHDSGIDVQSANGSQTGDLEGPYTFIPSDPREYFKVLLKFSLYAALQSGEPPAEPDVNGYVTMPLYPKDTSILIEECSMRWRLPSYSRASLFLDVIRESYLEQQIDLDALDAVFEYFKEEVIIPWADWTIMDQALHRKTLSGIYDGILREIHQTVLQCYEPRPPQILPLVYVLDTHLKSDPLFSPPPIDEFVANLKSEVIDKAGDTYAGLTQDIPENREEWDMYHIVDLGKRLLGLSQRIAKRYAEPILGKINVTFITIEIMFPAFAEDVENLLKGIYQVAKDKGEDLDLQGAFDMYAKLVEVRDVYDQVFVKKPFPFSVEDMVLGYVEKWLAITDAKVLGWVDNAIRADKFQVRGDGHSEPTHDQRHSTSVEDIFHSFTQSIKTLQNLHWGNPVQEAKFFTALSKSIGNGLTRYCEILESLFTKEMDRLSPEQEAELNKTQKEKLLSFFNTKEKIEPFNFMPETCVKFNDIEWAIQQLDLVEKMIDADKCAEVIAQNTDYYSQRRQVNNYVFTIKIVEGEDLKACDVNGLSDPYVVLGDEYHKRLAKTRVIYSTLNPRFDETVEITTQGPVLLTATIWDYDTVGSHDYVGRQSIKLDPSFFGDYQPREFWLDLDTQGRLLLKVSMEGERDDIQFYFGRTFRTLIRTERDMARQITDKCSAYIQHCLSRSALKSLLSKGLTIASVSNYFSRTGFGARPQSIMATPSTTDHDIEVALDPLFNYFNDNFEILERTLTRDALINVMTKLWKEVLVTLESLMVPPLSDKPSNQKPLSQLELDVVFKWLKLLFNFFSAPDEDGEPTGVATDILRSPKYYDLQSMSFFYMQTTEDLVRESERMASINNQKMMNSAKPVNLGAPGTGGAMMVGVSLAKRSKSVMMNRNLGTMKKAKEEKRKEAQAEPNDDVILRILRMRPDAGNFLRQRSQQKERLAAKQAAEAIVQQAVSAGAGRLNRR